MIMTGVSYAAWQEERGEAAASTHIQFMVEFATPVRLAAVQKLWPGCHAEIRRGTPDQAKSYVTKEDTRVSGPWEMGTFPTGQGHRTDLDRLAEAVSNGVTQQQLAEGMPKMVIRYHRGIQALEQYLAPPMYRPFLEVNVSWGETGTGKTWDAFYNYPDLFCVSPPTSRMWYDGYRQQKTVLLDDFRSDWMTSSMLLRVLDKYPMRLEMKGTTVAWNPKLILITSDSHPSEWFEDSSTTRQLMRRISKITHFS